MRKIEKSGAGGWPQIMIKNLLKKLCVLVGFKSVQNRMMKKAAFRVSVPKDLRVIGESNRIRARCLITEGLMTEVGRKILPKDLA